MLVCQYVASAHMYVMCYKRTCLYDIKLSKCVRPYMNRSSAHRPQNEPLKRKLQDKDPIEAKKAFKEENA